MMNCLCFKKKRDRKATTNGKTGVANLAYNQSEDAEENLDNNAVLEELDGQNFAADTPGKITAGDQQTTPEAAIATVQLETTPSVKATDPRVAELSGGQQKAKRPLTPASSVNTQDDNYVGSQLEECVTVDLISKDSIGLGVSVTGTLTDGIIISEMSDKGSAAQSGKVSIGDKILSVTISFDNMVYEDALTILSYASPYPVTLKLLQRNKSQANLSHVSSASVKQNRVCHPVYRSQSLEGNSASARRQKTLPPRPGTSLGQIECLSKREDATLGDDTLLKNKLVKDKFGNTLNLIDANDTTLRSGQEEETSMSQYGSYSEDYRSSNSDSISSSSGMKVSTVHEVNSPSPLHSPASNSSSQPPEKPKRIYLTELAGAADQPQENHVEGGLVSESTVEINESVIAPEFTQKQKSSLTDVEGEKLEPASTAHKRTLSETLREFDKPLLEDNIMMIEYEQDRNSPVTEELIVSTNKVMSESTPSFQALSAETTTEIQENTESQVLTNQVDKVAPIDSHDDGLDEATNVEDSGSLPKISQEGPENDGDASNAVTPEDVGGTSEAVTPADTGDDSAVTSDETEPNEEVEEDPVQKQKRQQEEEENILLRHTRRSLLTTRRTSSGSSSSLLDDGSTSSKVSSRSQLEAARARFFAELMQSSDLFKDSPENSLNLGTDKPINNNDSTIPSQELSAPVTSDANC